MSQTQDQYGLTSTVGQAGGKYSSQFDHVISRAAEIAIAPGLAVEPGTNPEKQVTPFAGGQFVGIAIDDGLRENRYLSDDGVVYEPTDPVSVMRKGAAWVEVAVAVEALEVAYITAAGAFTNVAEGNTEAGEFVTSADAEGLAALEINLPL